MVLLTQGPFVRLIVHPHRDGWRWAVSVGATGPTDLDHIAQAGSEPDELGALHRGEAMLIGVVEALRHADVDGFEFDRVRLDDDPVADIDAVRIFDEVS